MNFSIQANQRPKYYFVPSRMTSESDVDKRPYSDNTNNAVFYVNFAGFLPGKKIKQISKYTFVNFFKHCMLLIIIELFILFPFQMGYFIELSTEPQNGALTTVEKSHTVC